MLRALHFTETVDGDTYTAFTSVPAGGRIVDVLIETTTAWTAATADLDVGDSDAADALINAYDLTGVAFVNAKGSAVAGSAWGNSNGDGAPFSDSGTGKLYPSGDLITAVVSAGTPGGPTGISAVYLIIEQNPSVSVPATVTT